jgi:CHAD domain-containing protein
MRNPDPAQLSASEAVQEHARLVFDRMSRQLARAAKEPSPENVHRLRTNSRRVEALVDHLTADGGNKKKLLKSLSKLRKKAGRVRDLDVQIAFLQQLKVPDRNNHRAQLLNALTEEQQARSRKLAKKLASGKAAKLRKRLQKAKADTQCNGVDPLLLAFASLPQPGPAALSPKSLHAWRIAAKHSRYLAELAPDGETSSHFVAELKQAQDAIGQWHDILKLTERAEALFGGVRDSSLVSALQNITRARFRRAGNALQSVLRAVSDLKAEQPVRRLRPQPAARSEVAVA